MTDIRYIYAVTITVHITGTITGVGWKLRYQLLPMILKAKDISISKTQAICILRREELNIKTGQ